MTSITVESADSGASYWGTAVSDMQEDVTVSGQYISGTLKYLDSGQLVTDWGEGYFLALNFTDLIDGAVTKVGLVPSASSMPLQELDADHDGVFKITNKDVQEFVVQTTKGDKKRTDRYYLTTLVLEDTDA